MDHSETANLDQTDEDILSYMVSDEALEAAAGTERGEYGPEPLIHLLLTRGCGCFSERRITPYDR
jgi:hypothetical protein